MQALLDDVLQPLSPSEEEVDSFITSKHHSDHTRRVNRLPAFILPGAVECENEDEEERTQAASTQPANTQPAQELSVCAEERAPAVRVVGPRTRLDKAQRIADEW